MKHLLISRNFVEEVQKRKDSHPSFFISCEICRVWFSKALVNRKHLIPIFNLLYGSICNAIILLITYAKLVIIY